MIPRRTDELMPDLSGKRRFILGFHERLHSHQKKARSESPGQVILLSYSPTRLADWLGLKDILSAFNSIRPTGMDLIPNTHHTLVSTLSEMINL